MEEIKQLLWGLGQLGAGIGFACIPIAIYQGLKHKADAKKLEEQRRIKELEVENQNTKLRLLEEENRKYDRLLRRRIEDPRP
jgi:antitoxin component YwqK of YwqJK toxin-antitoxin module